MQKPQAIRNGARRGNGAAASNKRACSSPRAWRDRGTDPQIARTEQFATEVKVLGHGLFTYALLEALRGKGDGNGDGRITVKEVEAFLNTRVPELSEEYTGAAQYPNSFGRGQDFPIGLVR